MSDTVTVYRVGAAVMSLALVACLLVAGCVPHCPSNCEMATVDVRALNDSSVTWSHPGGPSQTTTGFRSAYPPAGIDCSFTFTRGQLLPGLGDAGADRLLPGYFDVRCGGGTDGGFDF